MENMGLFKLLGIVVSILATFIGLFFAYQKYKRESNESKHADNIVNEIIILKSQLYSFNETIQFLHTRWKLEHRGETEDSKFEILEQVYKEQARRLSETISKLESEGTLLFLFNPSDELFTRLLALRTWLAADTMIEHPLHSRNSEIVDEFTFGLETLTSYTLILKHLSQIKTEEQRYLVKQRIKSLETLDDLPEIERLENLLGVKIQ